MKVLLICDKNNRTKASIDLHEKIKELFSNKDYEIHNIEIGKKDLASCIGCFGCWIKTPGQCVINDMMSDINRSFINSDVVIYFTPIVFGQFSGNIKNAIDRWLPNVLPFFQQYNGRTRHPARYEKYPTEIIVGYSDDITEEEKSTFLDITNKHRHDIKDIFLCLREDKNVEIVENIKKYI